MKAIMVTRLVIADTDSFISRLNKSIEKKMICLVVIPLSDLTLNNSAFIQTWDKLSKDWLCSLVVASVL